jgi:hypothetical protein
MIRRLTIACGLLTLAVVLALQGQNLFGARHVHRSATSVTAIPDKPAFWPPVKPVPPAPPPLKGLPPAPQPQPMHRAPVVQTQQAPRPATGSTVQQVIGIVHTILNLPKAIGDDQTQVNPTR